jgi:hypothetical protein
MPIIINDNMQTSKRSVISDMNFDYDYPYRLKLRPKDKLHGDIVNKIMTMAQESYNAMSARYPAWAEIDEMLTAYIRPSADSKKAQKKDRNKPLEIVIPQSYANMEILLTYATAALLEDTIFRYEGRSPEDIIGALLLEKVVDMQMYYTKSQLALHTGFRDQYAYGFGLVAPEWIEEHAIVTRAQRQTPSFFDRLIQRTPPLERQEVREMIFEGNKLNNIDPYLALPDPNVSIHRIQDGEFFGWIDRTNYKALLSCERYDDAYFNVRYLSGITGNAGASKLCKSDQSGRTKRTGVPDYNYPSSSTTTRVDLIKMYVDLIPREWKLPGGEENRKGDYPETWFFEVGADEILIKAQRLGLNHGRKPIVALSTDFDGYSISPVSRMEILHGPQVVNNFLFNSHIANVRKAINDMFVYDPSLIDAESLNDPAPGKMIKLLRRHWGRGIEGAVQQLKTVDVTSQHMGDSQFISQLMKDVSGATDAVSGVRRKTSERVTAQEIQGDRQGALSRLEHDAKLMSWMGMQDLGYMIASHTQQLMSEETYVKITGRWQEVLTQEYGASMQSDRMKVSPFDILVAYDIISRDGSIPGSNFSQVWVQMLPQLMQNQELMQRFDLVQIVKHIMRNAGAKDVDQFDRKAAAQAPMPQANVIPNEQVQQEAQAGNIIPFNPAAGA